MSNENLIRDYYAAYNSGDASRIAALLDQDVTLTSAAGEQKGRDAYLATYAWMIGNFIDRMPPTPAA